jgi:hypothetical protein
VPRDIHCNGKHATQGPAFGDYAVL